MTFDLLIKNGIVFDSISDKPRNADIGLQGQEIVAMGNLKTSRGLRTIYANQMYVTPGFVDVQNHSDSYMTLFEIPSQESLLTQGITSVLVGQCGTSLAPLASPEALKSVQKWHSLAGTNLNWLKFDEYLGALRGYPLGVNVASLVGHSTVRRGILGDAVRSATSEEIKIMEKMIAESLDAGAAGLSLGLVYAHEANSSEDELLSAARAVSGRKKLLTAHLRSEGAHVVSGLDEVIALAEKSEAVLKISHFKIRGAHNFPYLEQSLENMERAYQRSTSLFFDVYPYSTSWTVLYTYLPKWAYEGGRASILKNIQSTDTRPKILDYLKGLNQDLGSIFIATSGTNPNLMGKTLAQIAANHEVSVEEALLKVLEATQTQVVVFDRNISEEMLLVLLKHPLSVIASDGAGYDFQYSPAHGLVHPRCFGAMPRFLSMVRDKKLMSWSEGIKKITSNPAAKMGLKKRGRLEVGNTADITIFNPNTIGSRATYENPYQQADGIEFVIVNGRLGFSSSGEPAEPAGQVLKI